MSVGVIPHQRNVFTGPVVGVSDEDVSQSLSVRQESAAEDAGRIAAERFLYRRQISI